MRNRLQTAFSGVHAEREIKERTLERIYAPAKRGKRRPLALAAACLALVLLCVGGGMFFTPVSAIGIEINPALQLKINRFDIVIGVKGLNQDGRRIAENTSVLFSEYSEAIDTLLNSSELKDYLEQGKEMDIYVDCGDEQRCTRMLERAEGCVGGCGNVTCHAGNGHGHGNGQGNGQRRQQRHRNCHKNHQSE